MKKNNQSRLHGTRKCFLLLRCSLPFHLPFPSGEKRIFVFFSASSPSWPPVRAGYSRTASEGGIKEKYAQSLRWPFASESHNSRSAEEARAGHRTRPRGTKTRRLCQGGQRRATLSRPRGDWNEILGLRTCSSTFRSLVAAAYALETGLRRWRL